MKPQSGIFVEGSANHWLCEYQINDAAALPQVIRSISEAATEGPPDERVEVVFAFGRATSEALLGVDQTPGGWEPFAGLSNNEVEFPATEADLLVWLHSDRHDRNFEVALVARRALEGVGELQQEVPAWVYRDSRDLTGFIDGTENPEAAAGQELAVIATGPGAGGALMFTQRWVHDLDSFHGLEKAEQEQVIGRTRADSEELDPVPENSHVGRVVIEDDAGEELEIYRRSVPYGTSTEAGLFFLAFPGNLGIIDDMLARMIGLDGPADRITDFSEAVSGAYLFAPSAEAIAELLAQA